MEQIQGKAGKGKSVILGPAPFNLLSQTKQRAQVLTLQPGLACRSVNEIKILSEWEEGCISKQLTAIKGLCYGQNN